MKNLLLLALVLFSMKAIGQAIPNGDFESWDVIPYDEPNGWNSSNRESYRQIGAFTATKVTGQSGSAIRLETKSNGTDTTGAYFINSEGNPEDGEGGVPYSDQPTHFTGYYKYSPVGNDTAILLVIFKKGGNIISMDFFKIGSAETNFTQFSFPLNLQSAPDSVIIGAAASNLIDEVGVMPGSVFVLDELAFTGNGATQAIPNGNLDAWTALSYESPDDWAVRGEGASRTTDANSGSYAINLRTIEYENNQFGSTDITNGEFDDNGPNNSGRPYTGSVDTLTGYYKYTATTQDSAVISITLSKNGNPIAGNVRMLNPVSNYTYFEIPFFSSMAADSMRIEIGSSKWPYTNASENSVLIVDNLRLKSDPITAINSTDFKSLQCVAYPNPVLDRLTIKVLSNSLSLSALRITDMTGKSISVLDISGMNEISIETEALEPGTYLYQLSSADGVWRTGKFIKK